MQNEIARFIDFAELERVTTLHKTKLYQEIEAGRLHPIKLGRKTVFLESEVQEWIRQRIAARAIPQPKKPRPQAVVDGLNQFYVDLRAGKRTRRGTKKAAALAEAGVS